MRCVSGEELNIVEATFCDYQLTDKQYEAALQMVEDRACDTSLPFNPYTAAHTAASIAKRQY